MKIKLCSFQSTVVHTWLLKLTWCNVKMSHNSLPLFVEGEVVKGFGRGSKDLGCPTANYSLDVVKSLPDNLKLGVYFGWAQVNSGPVQKMVANIGLCPYYQNKEKSIETHIMDKFDKDFYGSNLKVCVVGYLREEKNFSSIDDLIVAIKQDIEDANKELEKSDYQELRKHKFFIK